MHKSTRLILASMLLSSTLAAPAFSGITHAPAKHPSLPHYIIKDVGSLGGGFGLYSNPASRVLNRHGASAGFASTGIPDPFCPDWCFGPDGYTYHAFSWRHGTTDLGALTDDVSSAALGLNDKGVVTGISQTGSVDPATGAPVTHAVRWQNGAIQDLGVLGGNQSLANTVNRHGNIAAPSETGAADPYVNVAQANCLWLPAGTGTACGQLDFGTNVFLVPVTSQTHAGIVSPRHGLKDMGTLGGPDGAALDINDSNQAVGWSYASYDAGPSGVPDTVPTLWDSSGAHGLGSLGGTFGYAMFINNSGQVIGGSNLAGDTVTHPFIWDRDHGMQDLGSFGGWYSHPNWINDLGDVVGISSYVGTTTGASVRRAFYWHDGTLSDLGTFGTDDRSTAVSINNNRLIVGYTFTNDGNEIRAFISDQGGALVDLNTLIRKPHSLYVTAAYDINDRGEIAAAALTESGELHPVVLIPETDFDRLAGEGGDNQSAPVSPQVKRGSMHMNHGAVCGRRQMRLRFCAAQ